MWLVDSPTILLLFLACASILLGVWTYTVRLAGKARYDFFYLHFTLASVAVLLLLCFGLGMARPNDITILDSFSGISLRKMAWAVLAGVALGIGNGLIASTVPVSGMASAVGMASGMAFAVTATWTALASRLTAGWAVWTAVGLAVAASVAAALAYSKWFAAQPKAAVPKPAPTVHHHRSKAGATIPQETAVKGIVTALIGGLILGCVLPMHDEARDSLIGLPVYTALFFMALGTLASIVVMAPYYFFFPQTGMPGRIKDYGKTPAGMRQRAWTGGAVWALGILLLFAGLGPKTEVNVAPNGLQFFLLFAWPLVGTLAALLVWGEHKEGQSRGMVFASLALFAVSIGLAAWMR